MKKNIFLPLAIALNIAYLIPSFGQTDTVKKFCFTSTEMNYWIGASYDVKAYKKIIDSLTLEKSILINQIQNDTLLINNCDHLFVAQKKLTKNQEALIVKQKRRILLWEILSASIAAAFVIEALKK